jgi:hypothetical protein
LDGDAALVVLQGLDASDLGNVIVIAGLFGSMVRDSDEEAHADAIAVASGDEIKAVAGNIFCGSGIDEGGFARIGRTHKEGLADLDAARAASFLLAPGRDLHTLSEHDRSGSEELGLGIVLKRIVRGALGAGPAEGGGDALVSEAFNAMKARSIGRSGKGEHRGLVHGGQAAGGVGRVQ